MARLKFVKNINGNPFVDELVYYTQILGYSTVLKDEQSANALETKESLSAGDLYVACYEGKVTYELLELNRSILEQTSLPDNLYDQYIDHPETVPENLKARIKELCMQYYIDNYEETNNYYRMLNGLPDYGTEGMYVPDEFAAQLPSELVIDLDKHIHEMNDYEINILESYDILSQLRNQYPNLRYLNYLGPYKISIYDARSAERFAPLYVEKIESTEIFDKYRDALTKNRKFILATVYSEAYKYGSDYYDGFIAALIVLQAMTDILAEVQEFIARKEIFDDRSIKYLLASYNIPYYSEIPMKYQQALIKNLHTLIKYKSTDKNIIDICSLFGFEDIKIFKYYLLKERQSDADGNFLYGYREVLDEDGLSHYEQDDSISYDLKFVKVPFDGQADDYIKVENNYVDYWQVTNSDWSWANEVDPEDLRDEILRREFTYVRTKYYSIENVYEASRLSFDIPYFFNIIFDNKKLEELLTIDVYNLADSATEFKLSDIICFLFSLSYLYQGIEDDIIGKDQQKALSVLGFNFSADLAALNTYIINQGFTMEDLGVYSFTIPDSSILTMSQLVEIFTNNKKCYQNIIYGMRHAENKRIYDIYKKLYDTLLITENTAEFFRLPSGTIPNTITEYIANRDPALYKKLIDIQNVVDYDAQHTLISNTITNIVGVLEQYLDSNEFYYLYNNLPGVSSEYIKRYIIKLIDFFKSYKIDLLGIDTIYKFDDSFFNWIKIIDGIDFKSVFDKKEYMMARESVLQKIHVEYDENLSPRDKIYIDIYTWAMLILHEDDAKIVDKIYGLFLSMEQKDIISFEDVALYFTTNIQDDYVYVTPSLSSLVSKLFPEEHIPYRDLVYMIMKIFDVNDKVSIDDAIDFAITHDLSTIMKIADIKSQIISMGKSDHITTRDKIFMSIV